MMKARPASSSAVITSCSTSRIETPVAVDLAQPLRPAARPTRGARPSDSSSIISRLGRAISPRPIAHICCSPPDSVPASCRRRSARIGKHREDAFEIGCDLVAVVAQIGAQQQVVAHAHGREQPPALRHMGDAGAHEIGRARAGHVARRRTGSRPRAPAAARRCVRSSVVLPAPFEPMMADDLAGRDVEDDVPQHLHVAIAGLQAAHLELAASAHVPPPAMRRGVASSRDRPRSPRGSLHHRAAARPRRSAGRDAAPRCAAQIDSTTFIRCSITRMVTPRSAICRISASASSISAGLSPALTSSSISSFGLHREALGELEPLALRRASSVDGRLVGERRARPVNSRCSRAPRVGVRRGCRARRANSAPAATFSSTVISGTAARSGRCARGRAARSGTGRSRVMSLAVETDRARGRRMHAGDQVDQRGLAGAVRADQADDLALARARSETSSTARRPPKRRDTSLQLEQARVMRPRLRALRARHVAARSASRPSAGTAPAGR